MEKSEVFEQIIEGKSPFVQELARAARQPIFTLPPKAVEVIWTQQKIAGYGAGKNKK